MPSPHKCVDDGNYDYNDYHRDYDKLKGAYSRADGCQRITCRSDIECVSEAEPAGNGAVGILLSPLVPYDVAGAWIEISFPCVYSEKLAVRIVSLIARTSLREDSLYILIR